VLKVALGAEVNWTTKGSGVGVVVWADTEASEPPTSRDTRCWRTITRNLASQKPPLKT